MSVLSAPEEVRDHPGPLIQPSSAIGLQRQHRSSTEAAEGKASLFRQPVLKRLARIHQGSLTLVEPQGTSHFGDVSDRSCPEIRVQCPSFWRRVALGGGLGAADSYIRGEWDCPDLVGAMQVLARNMDVLAKLDNGFARVLRPMRSAMHWLKRNSRVGSRRNIAAHYDLSNDFFALMLDPSMTYSAGIFSSRDTSLEQASLAKYERICQQLCLTPDDHVLEVGCGWGGFAEYAAKKYGCRVTATTISDAQFQFAQRRIEAAQLSQQVTLLKSDYRDLEGKYDKLVSIEMIEAVGERYLDLYFQQCSRLLKSDGQMLLQAITMPDHRYDRYRKSVDFIQRYVFPGGFLPSLSRMGQSLRTKTDLRLTDWFDMTAHYGETLARWRDNFWSHIQSVRQLGFDETFIRTWHYYLCYCEAGFRERQTGVCQILLTKPNYRDDIPGQGRS